MSTKEMAYKIIENLNEEQLNGFVALFGSLIEKHNEQERRDKAFAKLQSLRKNVQDFDEEKELAEYREEKYGK